VNRETPTCRGILIRIKPNFGCGPHVARLSLRVGESNTVHCSPKESPGQEAANRGWDLRNSGVFLRPHHGASRVSLATDNLHPENAQKRRWQRGCQRLGALTSQGDGVIHAIRGEIAVVQRSCPLGVPRVSQKKRAHLLATALPRSNVCANIGGASRYRGRWKSARAPMGVEVSTFCLQRGQCQL